MLKSLRSAAMVAALALAGAARANANGVPLTSWSWAGCGGAGNPGFNTCASINISLSGNVLTITVENWGTTDPTNQNAGPYQNSGNSVFARIGIQNFGSGATLTGFSGSPGYACTNDTSCSWDFDSNLSSLNGYSGAGATPPPSSNGLDAPANPGPGQFRTVVLTFTTSGTVDLTNVSVAIHAISGPSDGLGGNCSTKLFVNGQPGSANSSSNAATTCAVDNPFIINSVPEPASMLLLATGLVGIGAAGFVRRRRV